MPSRHFHLLERGLTYATAALGLSCALLIGFSFTLTDGGGIGAWLIREEPKPPPWRIFEEEEILAGATIPADTHSVFHLPLEGFEEISRHVLLGPYGKDVRYWGYCFPQNYDPEVVARRSGFPGLFFLSEAERRARDEEQRKASVTHFSAFRFPTRSQIDRRNQKKPAIRHQVDVFDPGMLCYVMTSSALPLGLDEDGDRLNTSLEREIGTDPILSDTDSDGIWDGVEHLTGTNPLIRDTDSDNLIDGIEDKNWNGRIDPGETDPRTLDTDRDGLCDGLCRVRLGRQDYFMGEDENLNGKIDPDETSPLLVDTDGDRMSDYVEYVSCLRNGKTDCP